MSKKYRAIFSQLNEDNPTVIKLKNTLTNQEWNRIGIGQYVLPTDISYTENSWHISGMGYPTSTKECMIPIYDVGISERHITGRFTMYGYNDNGKLFFEVDSFDAVGVKADLSNIYNGTLCLPDITVYP